MTPKEAGRIAWGLQNRRIAVPAREIEVSEVYKEKRRVRSELGKREQKMVWLLDVAPRLLDQVYCSEGR